MTLIRTYPHQTDLHGLGSSTSGVILASELCQETHRPGVMLGLLVTAENGLVLAHLDREAHFVPARVFAAELDAEGLRDGITLRINGSFADRRLKNLERVLAQLCAQPLTAVRVAIATATSRRRQLPDAVRFRTPDLARTPEGQEYINRVVQELSVRPNLSLAVYALQERCPGHDEAYWEAGLALRLDTVKPAWLSA